MGGIADHFGSHRLQETRMISTRGRACATAATLGTLLFASPLLAAEPAIRNVLAVAYGPAPLDAFRGPQAVAVDGARGIVIVADSGKDRLVVLDRLLRSRGTLSFAPPVDGAPGAPRALAVDPRGRLLLVGNGSDVEVMNSRGVHLAYLRPVLPGGLAGRVRPTDVSVGASGLVYLLYEGERSGYLVLEADGRVLRSVGFSDPGEGVIAAPMALAVNDDESLVAIVDAQAPVAVRVYDAEGSQVAEFGGHGNGEGTFSLPVHVAWGPAGTLWVTDTLRHSISVFDAHGVYRGRIGGFGRGPGQFYYPVACEFAGDGRAVVLERAGARVQVLEVASPVSGTEAASLGGERSDPLAGTTHNVQWRKR
jgi:hypothetical protein